LEKNWYKKAKKWCKKIGVKKFGVKKIGVKKVHPVERPTQFLIPNEF